MKHIGILLGLITLSALYSCNENEKDETKVNDARTVEAVKLADSIVFKWETAPELKAPESVKYDRKRNILYVANINGNSTDEDGNGFISKLSLDGEIMELEWVTGLNAPKGMGIFNDHLYVADINKVVKISIESGEIISEYSTDAKFLNDIDIDADGNVYVSDYASDRIFRLRQDTFDIWLQSDQFIKPNGLFVKNEKLFVGTHSRVLSVDIKTKEMITVIDSTGSIDGLEYVGNNQYVFSDWSGHIQLTKPDNQLKLILNTAKDTIQAADIEYCKERDLILVPTFFHNTVSAYELVRK